MSRIFKPQGIGEKSVIMLKIFWPATKAVSSFNNRIAFYKRHKVKRSNFINLADTFTISFWIISLMRLASNERWIHFTWSQRHSYDKGVESCTVRVTKLFSSIPMNIHLLAEAYLGRMTNRSLNNFYFYERSHCVEKAHKKCQRKA